MRTAPIILAALIALFVALSPLAVAAQDVNLRLVSEGEAPDGGVMLRLVAEGSEPAGGEPLKLVLVTPPKENENAQENQLPENNFPPENVPPEQPENLPPENMHENTQPENLPPENAPPEQPETQPIWISMALTTPEELYKSGDVHTLRLVTAEEAELENLHSVRLVLAESGT